MQKSQVTNSPAIKRKLKIIRNYSFNEWLIVVLLSSRFGPVNKIVL